MLGSNSLEVGPFWKKVKKGMNSRGFEFDLAKAFADYLGVQLKIKVSDKWEEMIPSLKNGKAHVVAASFTVTPKRKKHVAFSNGYMKIHQHIITGRHERNIRGGADLNAKS